MGIQVFMISGYNRNSRTGSIVKNGVTNKNIEINEKLI